VRREQLHRADEVWMPAAVLLSARCLLILLVELRKLLGHTKQPLQEQPLIRPPRGIRSRRQRPAGRAEVERLGTRCTPGVQPYTAPHGRSHRRGRDPGPFMTLPVGNPVVRFGHEEAPRLAKAPGLEDVQGSPGLGRLRHSA